MVLFHMEDLSKGNQPSDLEERLGNLMYAYQRSLPGTSSMSTTSKNWRKKTIIFDIPNPELIKVSYPINNRINSPLYKQEVYGTFVHYVRY